MAKKEQLPPDGTSTSGDGTTAVRTDNSATTATEVQQPQPYSQFSGSNYAELEDFVRKQMEANKPETEEQRKKREKREKLEGIISGISDMGAALSNLFFTSQYAPNAYDPKNSMSVKAKERFEKAKAERERDQDRFMNYALTLGKIKDADRDFNFKVEQARQQQNNWKMAFDAGRADRAEDVNFRNKRAEVQDNQWQQQFDYTKEKDERNFNESVRQFNVSNSIQRQDLALQARRLQMERENNSRTYTLGEGQGSVTVPRAAINSHNFAVVYNSLPEKFRTAKGDPIYSVDALGNKVVQNYGTPSAEAMAIAVGAYLGDPSVPADQKTATRTALAQIGKKTGGNNRTMPGVE